MRTPGWKWPGLKWPGPRRHAEVVRIEDPWPSNSPEAERVETPVKLLLAEIEAAALAVYARHGLPVQSGQYARSPKSRTWRFLSDTLTAEERWALVLAQKDGSNWRFGSLEDLGVSADNPPDVRRAAQLLRSCGQLRTRLAENSGSSLEESLETAIYLGAAWRTLDVGPMLGAPRDSPLKLTKPAKARTRAVARAKPAAKSKL